MLFRSQLKMEYGELSCMVSRLFLDLIYADIVSQRNSFIMAGKLFIMGNVKGGAQCI